MGAVRAHHEEKLKQKLVGVVVARGGRIKQMSVAVLAANLAELAGPVGENTGKAGVGESGVIGAAAAVEAAADRPATVQSVFGMSVHAEGVLGLERVERGELVARAPEKFGAEKERIVNGAPQWLPAKCGIGGIEIG